MPAPNFPKDHWVHRYGQVVFERHGREYPALDCWGLNRVILREQCGIDLPSYLGHDWKTAPDRREIAEFFRSQITPETWVPVWQRRPETPPDAIACGERPFDSIWLRPKGRNAPIHVATVIVPGWMIHVEDGCGAVVEDYHERWAVSPVWRSNVEGVYRHEALCD